MTTYHGKPDSAEKREAFNAMLPYMQAKCVEPPTEPTTKEEEA